MVCNIGINDMPRGWTKKSELNKRLYKIWGAMIRRCYSPKSLEKNPYYKECSVCERWLRLSNFVEDVVKITNYDLWLNNKGIYALDKDIKSNGKCKIYCLENCMFVTATENSIQSTSTRDYSNKEFREKLSKTQRERLKDKENHPFYGKHLKEESKRKIGIANSTKVIRYDLNGNFLDIWNSYVEVERVLGICRATVGKCCRGESSHLSAGGYMWRYYKDNFDLKIEPCHRLTDSKKIVQYDKDNKMVKVWDSVKEISEYYGISESCIRDCCKGKQKTSIGFIWKYYEEVKMNEIKED